MSHPRRSWQVGLLVLLLGLGLLSSGCQSVELREGMFNDQTPPDSDVPRELDKMSLPTYQVEPPDILLVDAVKVVPKSPYKIEPMDMLQIVVTGTLLDQPIANVYPVDPGGTVNLGPAYGAVNVVGMTLADAGAAIKKHLTQLLTAPEVSVVLAQSAGKQQIAGEHLVGPDGTINLGTYGNVYVSGMTLEMTKAAIERHLSKFLESPEVSVDVFSYNSKVYYIIAAGGGLGDQVTRVPVTGNETVLDAIAQVDGLTRISSKRIWIARPAPGGVGCDQLLPVNWTEITRGASTATNYQVLPGDRIFIEEDRLVALDTIINKITAPFERVLGFTLLGTQTVQTINRFPRGLSNNQLGF
jgi:polysaccharide biosynthesis/export protein